MSNKVSKRLKLYVLNHETQVPELQAVELAAHLVGLSIEDFIRGAVLNQSATVIKQEVESQKRAAEEKQLEAAQADYQKKINGESTDGIPEKSEDGEAEETQEGISEGAAAV